MGRSNRLGLLNTAIQGISGVLKYTHVLDKGESFEDRRLALGQASDALTSLLLTRRAYTQGEEFDPRFLAFEFTRNIILRPNQVDLINTFLKKINKVDTLSGEQPAIVKQMIMG